MIDRAQIPTDRLEEDPHYEAALQEVVDAIPPGLPDSTMIRLDDVRSLMVCAWLRGLSWQKEHGS